MRSRFGLSKILAGAVAIAALSYLGGAYSAHKEIFPFSALRAAKAYLSPPPSRYTFEATGRMASDETKTSVPCPRPGGRTAVLLVAGQSNSGNFGGERHRSRHGDKVVNFYNGSCFVAASPLLGSDGTRGEYWTLLGNLLVDTGAFDTVVLAPVAVNGSLVSRWARGGDLHSVMLDALAHLRKAGYRVTHMLWHQGEADYVAGTSEGDYRQRFLSLVDALRGLNVTAPVYVSVASKCLEASNGGPRTHAPDNPIARAQSKLADTQKGILPGPNTDALLDDSDRYDDCHFGGSGARKTAEAWIGLLRASVASGNLPEVPEAPGRKASP